MRRLLLLTAVLPSSLLALSGPTDTLSVFNNHDRCTLDPRLLPLAAKSPSLEALLSTSLPSSGSCCPVTADPAIKRPVRLAFVTPWNAEGYAQTSLHAHRLTHVAPVWYRIAVGPSARVSLTGAENVDVSWIASLHHDTRVVPRFEITFARREDLEALLFFPRGEIAAIVDCVVNEVRRMGYHGATLEIARYGPSPLSSLVESLGTALHALSRDHALVLVIPAHHRVFDEDESSPSPFTRGDLRKVTHAVDYFSLNAYDHAGAIGRESGNAPIAWTRRILRDLLNDDDDDENDDDPFGEDEGEEEGRKGRLQVGKGVQEKILLGLNFYGYTFTADGVMNSITAKEYLGLLQFSKFTTPPLTVDWLEDQAEHRMHGKVWSIWYPTLLSLLYRIDLAREFGVGISVWEAGQGLDHFWEVM